MTVLAVRNLTRRFGKTLAVDDVSFEVARGAITGFIGPNGAGKTTTMRICATLEMPDQGDVFIDGRSVLEYPREVRTRLGFMPDSFGAYTNMTVAEYLDFFARAYRLRGKKRLETIAGVTEFTALTELLQKRVTALSKGMKQRLCLARTLLHDPALMILDEPAAGLDPRARVELRELVSALASLGKAVLISSHILTELSELCDSVVIIERGKVCAQGKVSTILRELAPHRRIFMRALADADRVSRFLLEQPHVENVRREAEGHVLEFAGDETEMAGLLARLVEAGLTPIEFAPDAVDLEDAFLRLTQGQVQ